MTASTRVVWKVVLKTNHMCDIYENGRMRHQDIPENKLRSQMVAHHVRGTAWHELWRQLAESGEGEIVIDPSPPGRLLL